MRTKIFAALLAATLAAALPLVSSADDAATSKPAAREVISFRKIKEVMPDKLGDLVRTRNEGQSMKTAQMSMSTVTASYAKNADGEAPTVEITTIDYSNSDMVAAASAWSQLEMNTETDDEYTKTTKIDGNPTMEQYNTKNKDGTLTIVVASRFMVTVHVSGMEEADFKKLQAKLPLKAIADLAK